MAKSEQVNREASIRIRLSADEKTTLEDKAWKARKSVSAYVRDELELTSTTAIDGLTEKGEGER